MREIKVVTSYSGAKFSVTEDNLLIKECRNLYGSGIMQIQHSGNSFLTPEVYAIGEDHIVMQYLHKAVSLPVYLNSTGRKEAYAAASVIKNYIISNATKSYVFVRPDVLINKIYHIITRLQNFEDIELAKKIISKIPDSPISVNVGKYHGDLTFSNIIVDSDTEEFYLIDFLPGYLPSHWLDVVKIKQEISVCWSGLFLTCGENYNYTLALLKSFIEECFAFESATLQLMEAINFLRILPYAESDSTVSGIVKTEIVKFLK